MILRSIAITGLAMSFALAQAPARKSSSSKASAASRATTHQAVAPKGAIEIEPNVYKHTDANGKTSIYRKTPFGLVKSDDLSAASGSMAPQASERPAAKSPSGATASPFGDVKPGQTTQSIKVIDRGDTLEFERPSPFGSYKWKNKKTALTPEEREAWAQAQGTDPSTKTTGTKE